MSTHACVKESIQSPRTFSNIIWPQPMGDLCSFFTPPCPQNICGWAIQPGGLDRPPCPGERERERERELQFTSPTTNTECNSPKFMHPTVPSFPALSDLHHVEQDFQKPHYFAQVLTPGQLSETRLRPWTQGMFFFASSGQVDRLRVFENKQPCSGSSTQADIAPAEAAQSILHVPALMPDSQKCREKHMNKRRVKASRQW